MLHLLRARTDDGTSGALRWSTRAATARTRCVGDEGSEQLLRDPTGGRVCSCHCGLRDVQRVLPRASELWSRVPSVLSAQAARPQAADADAGLLTRVAIGLPPVAW